MPWTELQACVGRSMGGPYEVYKDRPVRGPQVVQGVCGRVVGVLDGNREGPAKTELLNRPLTGPRTGGPIFGLVCRRIGRV